MSIEYQRHREYRLTRSVSVPNLQAVESEQEHGEGAEFIGYHGTNEASARTSSNMAWILTKFPTDKLGKDSILRKTKRLPQALQTPGALAERQRPRLSLQKSRIASGACLVHLPRNPCQNSLMKKNQ